MTPAPLDFFLSYTARTDLGLGRDTITQSTPGTAIGCPLLGIDSSH
jgi:hypothetical protein